MALTSERYDKDSVRIMRDGAVVGMILRHADDRWSINDTNERRMAGVRFSSPARAMRYARTMPEFAEQD